MNSYRTHTCSELRAANIGKPTTLIGWVDSVRDHGGVIFIDLRDRSGITQVVFHPEVNQDVAKASQQLRSEDMIQISGTVAARLKTDTVDTTNADLPTGEIEVSADTLNVINKADVLPFQLDRALSNEDLRLKYRFLDLRRPAMARNMQIRHRVTKATRDYLDEHGFLEIETPILSKSTPEGARDFLVPSRLAPGKFYALPQAPQQYKQLLMVAGMERYFQIARCFRDEDLRADRQPEFTQVDIEASFITPEDIYNLVEGLLKRVYKESLGVDIPTPFPRMTWKEAMDQYGSDKPERRFGMKLTDVSSIFENSGFKVFASAVSNGGVVKAINAKGFGSASVGQIDALTKTAVEAGAKGLAYIKVREEDWRSPISKFLSDEEKQKLTEALDIETGDLVLFAAGPWEPSCDILGRVRLQCAEFMELLKDNKERDFLWVIEFPLVGWDEEEQRWVAIHHPFTRPVKEDEQKLLSGELSADLRAQAYDVVLNGTELGGGSIRIHERDLQSAMFKALGITEEQAREQFGHILDAFSFGAPPHGGLALGLDRLVMMICNAESIREVIAFPKNNRGADLMSDSPAAAEDRQLRDIHIQVKLPAKNSRNLQTKPRMAIIPSGVFHAEKQGSLSQQAAHHSSRAFASPGIRTTFPSSMTAKNSGPGMPDIQPDFPTGMWRLQNKTRINWYLGQSVFLSFQHTFIPGCRERAGADFNIQNPAGMLALFRGAMPHSLNQHPQIIRPVILPPSGNEQTEALDLPFFIRLEPDGHGLIRSHAASPAGKLEHSGILRTLHAVPNHILDTAFG